MEEALTIALPLVIQYAPELVDDIKAALTTGGYTVAQIDAIFDQIAPYEKLGINPNAPVLPASSTAPAAPAPAPAAAVSAAPKA